MPDDVSTQTQVLEIGGPSLHQGAGAKLVTPEQMELSRLRAENARLRMRVDIPKRATAYFAKDAL